MPLGSIPSTIEKKKLGWGCSSEVECPGINLYQCACTHITRIKNKRKGLSSLNIFKAHDSRAWWRMLVIPAFGRLRPEDRGSRTASAT